jgi:hypothetical protein
MGPRLCIDFLRDYGIKTAMSSESQPQPSFLHRLRSRFAWLSKFFGHSEEVAALKPDSPPAPIGDETMPSGQSAWRAVCELTAAWIADNKVKSDLVFLIEDRMIALQAAWPGEGENAQLQSFAITATDFYDELGWLPTEPAAECEQKDFAELRIALSKALISLGAALIHRPEWDSAVQRAISIERTDAILAAPKILRFGRTGVTLGGALLRKQEVVLLSN